MLLVCQLARAEHPAAATTPPSPRAADAIRLLQSEDLYQRQLGFLRLEALREPSTLPAITPYLKHRDADTRAYSLRAVAAIEGPVSIPLLLEKLKTDPHPEVRRAALLGLELFQPLDPKILPAAIKAMRDRKVEVRISAIDIVSRIDDPRARQAIALLNKRERNADVRRVLTSALRRIETR